MQAWMPVVLLVGCGSDFEIQKQPDGPSPAPVFAVSPTLLSLAAPLGEQDTATITLRNDGNAALNLLGAEIISGTRFSVSQPALTRLEPDESTELTVTFEALVAEEAGVLWVYSDDPDLGTVEVQLYGHALSPLLAITPDPVEFGSRTVGCVWERTATLHNDGDSDLTIDAVLASGMDFTLIPPSLPQVLAPGDALPVSIRFAPTAVQTRLGSLLVGSDDPGGDRAVSLIGTGADAALTEQSFKQGAEILEKVDILIYIDKSGSMGDDNERLQSNAARFMADLDATGTDYQLMVVTSDFGCHNETIITPSTASPETLFVSALDGAGGGFTEAGLSVALRAIEASGPGDCNAGFQREGVQLSVILISDEPEQSPDGWEAVLDDILAIAPGTIVSAIAGDYPGGCATAEAGVGYYEAVQATGGAYLSICATDWSPHVAAISDISTEIPGDATDTFVLKDYPDPGTLIVQVDDVVVTSGWHYDPKLNAIVFDTYPPDGAEIWVTFTRGCG